MELTREAWPLTLVLGCIRCFLSRVFYAFSAERGGRPMVGISPRRVIIHHFVIFSIFVSAYHPEDIGRIRESWRPVSISTLPLPTEYRLREVTRPNSTICWQIYSLVIKYFGCPNLYWNFIRLYFKSFTLYILGLSRRRRAEQNFVIDHVHLLAKKSVILGNAKTGTWRVDKYFSLT